MRTKALEPEMQRDWSQEEEQERYRARALAHTEGIFLHRDGLIIDANEEFARVLGQPLQRIIGGHVLELVQTETARHTIAARLKDPSKCRYYEMSGARPSGEPYWVEVRSDEILFQNLPTRVVTVRDITARKQMEQELRRSEHEMRGILENMQDTFYRTNKEGLITLASPSCYELLRYAPEELIGKPIADLYVHPEDRSRFLELLSSTHGRITQHRTLVRRKDGKQIWVSTNAQYYYDLDGNLAGVEGTTRDITNIVKAEEELQRAFAAVEAASRAKGEFLAIMSHEIRTPMNGILTTTQLLEGTSLNEEQHRYVATISNAGRLLYTLLNDILDLSTLEAGKLKLISEEFEFGEMLQKLRALMEPMASGKGLSFVVRNRSGGPLYLRGDQMRLQQILINLLSNAIKFTDRGFVGLTVTATAQEGGYRLEMEVEDSGIGIPPHDQQRLFRPFEQGDASITRRVGGMGVGLAITRELVSLMKGTISVASEPAQGTRINVTVTLDKGGLELKRGEPEESISSGVAPLRLLLVDDDDISRRAMGALLQRDGHQITLANSGAQTLEFLARDEFDYLLIDIHMPEIDGVETVSRFKKTARGAASRMGIVALSADTRREMAEQCNEAGIPFVLPKPLVKRDLYRVLYGEFAQK